MEEIFSLPPIAVFDNNYQTVLEFMDTLGNPKFKIAGNLYLRNSDIESLGNLVEVKGDLNLYGSKITSLPDNLHVGGYLDLRDTNIKSLPNNLKVDDSLDLEYILITSLPNNLKVGSNLFLERTPLSEKYTSTEIRKIIENMGGYVKRDIYI